MTAVPKTEAVPPIVKTIEVARDPETAFRFYTERIGEWWPLATHANSPSRTGKPARNCIIEPRVGGRVYEIASDGEEHVWGRVTVWEPGKRLVHSWHLSRGEAQATEVEITFAAIAPGRTRVTLEHRHWERWGGEARERRADYDKGWNYVLGERFAAFCAGS